ncbi:MAG: nitroreductase [Bacteroidaceae bacterium]|nr:nitroreductase [Bacteroidaceae bacterium]
MKAVRIILGAVCACSLWSCTAPVQQEAKSADDKNEVIETIMTRRSVRKYKPQPVGRDTMEVILECGINAPNAINKQAWEVRVVDNPEFINGMTEVFKKVNPKMAEDPNFKNMFRNAPTVAFIANDTTFAFSPVDCGLLAENMMLSAWSMGIGSVCLGSSAHFINTTPEAAEYLKQLGFSENYKPLICIGFGYPDEAPAAKPRDKGKVKFVD